MTRPIAGRAVPHIERRKRLLRPREAAEYLGKPYGTLQNWRSKDYGPPYIKCGNSVRYDPADLEAYIAKHKIDPEAR